MTSMYNKLFKKQDGLFSSSWSYLHKGQGSSNELKNIDKPFDFIKLCFFMTTFSSFDKFIRIYHQTMNL
jgi:hypothetical protein